MTKLTGLVLLLVCLGWSSANSFGGTYSFGGGCASMGAWSQAALSQTRAIIGVIENLKNDPNCKGIESIIPKLAIAQNALQTPEDQAKRTDRLESIPNEINALRSFAVASPELKNDVFKLLTSRTLEGASLAAESTSASPIAAAGPEAAAIAMAVKDLSVRIRRTALTGMDMMDQVFAILPSYDRCLIGHPDQGLAVLSASIKLAGAFASSQEGITSRLGSSLSNLITMLRNRKFSSALRKLDQTEFWLSMSCLLETTTQTYCAARDARRLLDYSIANLKPKTDQKGNVAVNNPLEGYYILTHDIPNVSQWLQKIQFGIRPKLSTDALFKNRVLKDVNTLMSDINSIQGIFSEEMLSYSSLKDVSTKQNALLKLVRNLTDNLTRGAGGEGAGSSGRMNFFTLAIVDEMMPFYLIGLKEMPDVCRPPREGEASRFPVPWDQWMLNGGKFQAKFQDPDDLSKVIGQQLERLIDSALNQASLYFQQRMIVDLPSLVGESLTSQTRTVVESMVRIQNYLTGLQVKIATEQGDLGLVASIQDVRLRLQKVLDSYEQVRKIGRHYLENPNSPLDEDVRKAYAKVVETAFEQFNVLMQRDTFLSNRISILIQYDYALRLKKNSDIGAWEKEILLESGNEMLYRLMSSTGKDPASMAQDLTSAQIVNKRNLETLEQFFSDSLYPVIDELNLIAKGRKPSDAYLSVRSLTRLYRDSYTKDLGVNTWMGLWAFTPGSVFSPSTTLNIGPFIRRIAHPELYPFHLSNHPSVRGADDEAGSFEEFKSKLCIQTLAFENRKFFEPVCKGSVLRSPFDINGNGETQKLKLNASYNNYMRAPFRDWAVTGDSICALQNHSRRNLVYWMTLDLQSKKN